MTCAGAEFGHNNRFQELYCVVIVLINPKARRMQCATLQKGGLAEFPVRVACIYGSCRVGQEEDGLIAGPYTEQHRPKAAVTATVNVVRTSLPVRSCWLYCNMRRAAKWVVCITHARRSPNLGRRPSAVSEGALACSDARAANRIWLPEVCAMKQQGGRSMEVLSLIFIVVAAQVNAMDRSLESRMTTLGRQNGPGAPATHGSSPRSESVPAGASQTFAQGAIVDADSVHLGKIEDVDDDDEQYRPSVGISAKRPGQPMVSRPVPGLSREHYLPFHTVGLGLVQSQLYGLSANPRQVVRKCGRPLSVPSVAVSEVHCNPTEQRRALNESASNSSGCSNQTASRTFEVLVEASMSVVTPAANAVPCSPAADVLPRGTMESFVSNDADEAPTAPSIIESGALVSSSSDGRCNNGAEDAHLPMVNASNGSSCSDMTTVNTTEAPTVLTTRICSAPMILTAGDGPIEGASKIIPVSIAELNGSNASDSSEITRTQAQKEISVSPILTPMSSASLSSAGGSRCDDPLNKAVPETLDSSTHLSSGTESHHVAPSVDTTMTYAAVAAAVALPVLSWRHVTRRRSSGAVAPHDNAERHGLRRVVGVGAGLVGTAAIAYQLLKEARKPLPAGRPVPESSRRRGPEQHSKIPVLVGTALGVLLIGIALSVYLRKRRQRRELLKLAKWHTVFPDPIVFDHGIGEERV
ncbi:Uncharacterized protein PBTT_03062 [Plasmodiophora brassicae]|uniref:Uncharacterized protein n=1 Tax=Plasmodiophora brassicae TaxID=37360 RepID=A0A0G4J6N9_PLABS|nr:hypothetical protein PBRA_003018 [Plasmodiophora brassicae]SPQ95491.1 unnamed protein product [Plasmodiophora brassicae]